MPAQSDNNGLPIHGIDLSVDTYLEKAEAACAEGFETMGVHLYLAAFGLASSLSAIPCEDAIDGLKRAWSLACKNRERALAEYIYGKLEPYLNTTEVAHCTNELQSLALDRLAEFGLSRDALAKMALTGTDLGGPNAKLAYVGSFKIPEKPAEDKGDENSDIALLPTDDDLEDVVDELAGPGIAADSLGDSIEAAILSKLAEGDQRADEPVAEDSADVPAGEDVGGSTVLTEDGFKPAPEPMETPGISLGEGFGLRTTPKNATSDDASPFEQMMKSLGSFMQNFERNNGTAMPQTQANADGAQVVETTPIETYADLVGYDNAIKSMEAFGIGLRRDPEFEALVESLNSFHGLSSMPATDALIFRSLAREDASRFMEATANEIGLPVLRMGMDENLQGALMLCLTVRADKPPKLNKARSEFEGPAILCLENIDVWMGPMDDYEDEFGASWLQRLTRGAREAITLIRNAVANPNVYVLATMSAYGEVDGFFCDLLTPFSVVEIDVPDEAERTAIWQSVRREHPSLRELSMTKLVDLSANMPRADIYIAVREAIEEAYKQSLAARYYMPVTGDNLFEKLSAYQPLDSDEYKKLEDHVAQTLRNELDEFDSVDALLGIDVPDEDADGFAEDGGVPGIGPIDFSL